MFKAADGDIVLLPDAVGCHDLVTALHRETYNLLLDTSSRRDFDSLSVVSRFYLPEMLEVETVRKLRCGVAVALVLLSMEIPGITKSTCLATMAGSE